MGKRGVASAGGPATPQPVHQKTSRRSTQHTAKSQSPSVIQVAAALASAAAIIIAAVIAIYSKSVPRQWAVSSGGDSIVCNIDRLNPEEWRARFLSDYHLSQPAILTGWRSNLTVKLMHATSRHRLLSAFGEHQIGVGNGYSLNVEGRPSERMRLSDYLERMANNATLDWYFFDAGFFLRESGLAADWVPPPGFDELSSFAGQGAAEGPLRFSIGGPGQGIAFHWHQDALSLQLHGRKRWALYAPGQMTSTGYLVTEPLSTWREQRTTAAASPDQMFVPPTHECVQQAGEVFYVPEGFVRRLPCLTI